MSKKFLTEGWNDTRNALVSGLSGKKKAVFETLLENQRKVLLEHAVPGATSASQIASINQVILPLIRRVFPQTFTQEIVGVQPLKGPVGLITTIRFKYADTFGTPNAVNAGSEALGPFNIASFYTGNGNSDNPAAAATPVLEGTRGRALKTETLKHAVQAMTRKLHAEWTPEAAQDADSQYSVDLEAESLAALAAEIAAEQDQEILFRLRRLAGTPAAVWDQSNTAGVANSVLDEHSSLAVLIRRHANLISQRTRLGRANWVVVSNTAYTVLQSASMSVFSPTTKGNFDAAPDNQKKVGTFDNNIDVYLDNYAAETTPVLVGLKYSDNSAPLIYSPYVPLQSTGVIVDPQTFNFVVGLATRYAITELTSTSSSFGNAADYLAAIGIANPRFF